MHGLVTLFLEIIALAIILLVVGLGTFQVLVVTSRAIMVLVVLINMMVAVAPAA